MNDKPTGVFVRLPLGADREETFFETSERESLNAALLAIGTPVTGGELDASRECFERFYAQMCTEATGCAGVTPDYVRGLRSGDSYGPRPFLNNIWEAWPNFAALALALLAARDAEIARLREAVTKTSAALERVTEERMTSYQAKNGRWVSIQGDDGERCDIIHSDVTTDCEAAIILAHKALKGGAV